MTARIWPGGQIIRRTVCALSLLGAAVVALAQVPPSVRPEDVGFSPERLSRVGAWVQREIAAKRIPGAVVLVVRDGKTAYYEAFGQQNPARDEPMRRDSIFRIYSMTKPIVSVAAMMLVEEGQLLLEAPVSRYLPAFGNVKVGTEKVDAAGNKSLELVPVRRAMTVQDLMRHTSGLTYGFFGDSLVKKAYVDAGIGISGDVTTADFVDKLATMPLHYQPGSTWDYSYSTDVLGRVLEVVSGKPLGVAVEGAAVRSSGHEGHQLLRAGGGAPDAHRRALAGRPDHRGQRDVRRSPRRAEAGIGRRRTRLHGAGLLAVPADDGQAAARSTAGATSARRHWST